MVISRCDILGCRCEGGCWVRLERKEKRVKKYTAAMRKSFNTLGFISGWYDEKKVTNGWPIRRALVAVKQVRCISYLRHPYTAPLPTRLLVWSGQKDRKNWRQKL